ncbi:hypothetical protein DICVIV_03479 [Dictyocaulus viviparus]|uniref:C2H2-type domain-containing protein n=1 Tax=Dictyocaulus viviparus TaxID=29172 RepID=A0A0D8Y6Z7_DICVI|nr:hypothetical protein DICVIV_03479 [Dictyocaulus viviparus]
MEQTPMFSKEKILVNCHDLSSSNTEWHGFCLELMKASTEYHIDVRQKYNDITVFNTSRSFAAEISLRLFAKKNAENRFVYFFGLKKKDIDEANIISSYGNGRVREQLSEMQPRENASVVDIDKQEPTKRRRGRPKKNPDEVKAIQGKRIIRLTKERGSSESSGEFSVHDDDIEDEEEVREELESDPNDPEFEPNRRTNYRRRKSSRGRGRGRGGSRGRGRAWGNGSGRGRGRPRRVTGKKEELGSNYSFIGINEANRRAGFIGSNEWEYERLKQDEVLLYEKHLPKLPPTIPDPVQRLYVVRVDSLNALVNAGAGFRLLARCVTDDMMVSLFHLTTDRYFVNSNVEDVLQLAQWNVLPLSKRLAWENAARKLALNKFSNKVVESLESGDVCISNEAMPIREFPFGIDYSENSFSVSDKSCKSLVLDASRKLRGIQSSCCSIRETWHSFIDVQSHLLSGHYTAIFYGCHFCGLLFHSVEALLSHSECVRWSRMLLSEMVKGGGKQFHKVEMKIAYLFMVCTDCGLWLPIRESHSCKKLLPLLVYMAERMEVPSRDARLLIQLIPSFLKNFPIACEECKIDLFPTPDEMDSHFQNVHHIKYKCTKCGHCSGTELYHKLDSNS